MPKFDIGDIVRYTPQEARALRGDFVAKHGTGPYRVTGYVVDPYGPFYYLAHPCDPKSMINELTGNRWEHSEHGLELDPFYAAVKKATENA